MSKCVSADMHDVLPDFVHGQLDAGRAAEVRAHLVECADCAAEVALLRAVVASAAAAPRMDIRRIASALPTPTRHGFLLHRGEGSGSPLTPSVVSLPMPQRSRLWSRPLVKIAAAVAIVAAGGLSLLVGRDVLRPEAQVGQVAPTAPATLPSIGVPPATSIPVATAPVIQPRERQTQQVAVATAGLSLAGELQELSDEHIATLLSEMEEMDGLPAAEPDALEPAVGNDSSGENQ